VTWLIIFLLNHAPKTALNKWACDKINSQPGDGSGCYDWCLARSMYAKTDGNIHDVDGRVTYHNDGKFYQTQPTGLSEDFSHDIQNACAVVLLGGEY
jgi:hypothetical protein